MRFTARGNRPDAETTRLCALAALARLLYFPGEAPNRSDGLFRKELLIRTAKNAGWLAGRFDFVVD